MTGTSYQLQALTARVISATLSLNLGRHVLGLRQSFVRRSEAKLNDPVRVQILASHDAAFRPYMRLRGAST